jgi:hypothetical protein
MVVERFVILRRRIVRFFEEIKSENADISNEKYSELIYIAVNSKISVYRSPAMSDTVPKVKVKTDTDGDKD